MSDFTYKIEQELDLRIPLTAGSVVSEAARYSLMAGGKRIRPVMLMEFYRLCGGMDDAALPFAAALEMIHTYSLIHDDLPCMDNDDLRRGKPSCHKAFGEDVALLAGDALLTHAFLTAAKTADLPADRVTRAISVLAEKAGLGGMVQGQALDLAFETKTPTAQEILTMYTRKTSGLLQAAAMIGCILAGASEPLIAAAEEYGRCVGLAFQIIDDILDVTADESVLGKPGGSDEKNGKTTYVTLCGLEHSRSDAARLTDAALAQLEKFDGDTTVLRKLTEQLLIRTY